MYTFSVLAGIIILISITAIVIISLYFRAREKKLILQKAEAESNLRDQQIENAGLKRENESVRLEKTSLEKQLDEIRKDLIQINSDLAARKQEIIHYQDAIKNKNQEFEEQRNKLTSEFKNLANEILEEKTRKFTEQNSVRLDEILKPFNEKLHGFERKVEDTYQKTLRDQTDLQAELKKLQDLNVKISQEANNLTRALKGDVKKQGNWGEMILEKILERSGLRKGIEYETQVSMVSEDGRRIQPDVVVYLPDNKQIIIDAKVSLIAYEHLVNADDEDDRQRYLKEHIISLRKHVRELSEKSYSDAKGINSPDFVLLFVPVEASFSLAVQADHEIFNEAWANRIVIVSPTTLLATLMTIASIWKQENQTRNALEIAEEGARLYDKVIGLVEDFIKLGEKLDSARDIHSQAMKKAKTGTGNIINRIEKMKSLGLKTKKHLPESLSDYES